MLVSVITSVFNCEKYVSEMIDSILAQTYTNWELIIFDDASTDNTWNIISQYHDSRIRKFRNQENKGLTINLNEALKLANGTYIARIDGDDIAYPRRLEKQIQFMNQRPDVVLSGCWMMGFGLKNAPVQIGLDWEILRIKLLFNAIVFHPTFIIRKSILDRYQIQYNEKLRYAQDYNMEYQLSKYGKIKNIPEILMRYRFHESQVTSEKGKEQISCANITRKLILSEMGIELNNEEYEAWNHFGTFSYTDAVEKEIIHIKNIIGNIISANETKRIYNETLLKQITSTRLKLYASNYKSDNKKEQCSNGENDKYYRLFFMMTQWKKLNKEGIRLGSFLEKKGIYSIAIYGMGYVGKALLEELQDSGIEIKYGIDRNIESTFGADEILIVTPDDDLESVDAIIVTAISQYGAVKSMLQERIKCHIYSLEDVIYSM